MENKTFYKKQITLQLEKGKGARHIIFNIELRNTRPAQDWETLEPIAAPVELSICGAERLGGCSCQKKDIIKTYAQRVKTEDQSLFAFVLDIWEKYHLNTMKAGTKKQTQFLTMKDEKLLWCSNYEKACDFLKGCNLYEDRGYKYGTGWLVEQIPAEIIDKIMKL